MRFGGAGSHPFVVCLAMKASGVRVNPATNFGHVKRWRFGDFGVAPVTTEGYQAGSDSPHQAFFEGIGNWAY